MRQRKNGTNTCKTITGVREKTLALVMIWVLVLPLVFSPTGMNAFADDFVPSIGSKGAPEVAQVTDAHGDPVTDEIILTPYGDRTQLKKDEKQTLEEAFACVDMQVIAETVNESIRQTRVTLPQSWQTDDVQFKSENLTVTDIFYVHEKYDTQTVDLAATMTLAVSLSEHQFLMVMYYQEDHWVYAETVRNEDGTLSFKVDAYGPYMIVTNTVAEAAGNGEDIPSSPQTGYDEDILSGKAALRKQ